MSTISFGKYIVVKPLGRGGMAEVHLARDPLLDRNVAIKVIYPHLANDPDFGERFRREAKLVASLRHNHIVQVYDFDVQNDQPYMVMEYLDGGSLKTRLEALRATGQTLPLAETARILDAIASALDYAHAHGAIHRDVKPANIILTSANEPVLTDFGIAKIVGDAAQLSASGSIVGSPAYMSPEQATSKPVDARSDLYSLGVVLYEMTTGRVPFQGDSPTAVLMQHLNTAPPAPRQFNANIPEATQAVILKTLAKNPAARFPSATELARAFSAALRGQAPESPTVSSGEQTLVDEKDPAKDGPPIFQPLSKPIELTERRQRLIGRLGILAELFAPFVGRKVPKIEMQDRRSLIATILGILGILLAALQLLSSFFDLMQRPIGPLFTALPYIIVALFIGSAVLSIYVIVRSPSATNRKRAFGALAMIAVVGIAWGAWIFFNRVRPVDRFVVLVADFDKRGTLQADVAYAITRDITQNLGDANKLVTLERANEVIKDSTTARARGTERKATMVIWGVYDDKRVYPTVEVLKIPTLVRESVGVPFILQAAANELGTPVSPNVGEVTQSARRPATLSQIAFDTKTEDQAADLSTALLGMAFYANGDPTRAKELLDKGLGRLEPSKNDITGLESLYFQRATVLYGLGQLNDAVSDLQQAIKIKDSFEAHYNLALLYAEVCNPTRQLDRAIAEAEKAAQAKSNNAAAHRLLGELYTQAGKFTPAIDELNAALKIDPNDPQTYQALATAQQARGQTDAAKKSQATAVSLWQKMLTTLPTDSVDARLARGDALMNTSDYTGALAEYQAAQKIAPDDPRVHRGLGNSYYHSSNLALAVSEYEQWVKLSPKDASARILLGLAYVEVQRTPSAIEQLQKATALATCSADAYVTLGSIYYQQNNYAQAIDAYTAATVVDPKNANAFYMAGILHYLQDQFDPATKALETAVALQADYTQAHFALGSAYYLQGAYQKAATARETLVQLAPNVSYYHESLAYAYEHLGRLDAAASEYQKALALEENAQTRTFLGTVLMRQQKYAPALAEFQKAIALNPNDYFAHGALGDVYAAQGNWNDAIVSYQNALARQDVAATHFQLASAYVAQNKTDLAIAEYQKAAALDPKDPLARLTLGNLYGTLGKFDEAVKEYRAALAIKADSVDAYLAIANTEYKRCNLSAATQAASSAAAIPPIQSRAKSYLAAMYLAQGRTDDAAKIYSELRNMPASDSIAHLVVGEYFYHTDNLSEAQREFQIVLETANLTPLLASIAHYDLGQVYFDQDKLIPAESEYNAALTAFPMNALAQSRLGDLAMRKGDFAGALKAYDQTTALLPSYAQIDSETMATMNVSLPVARSLALARQNKRDESNAALDQGSAQAQRYLSLRPQSPTAHFILGYIYLVRGDNSKADAQFATAIQCDQSMTALRARVQEELAKINGAGN
ncbi:MAG: tetratricopeptide repeat protein [Chloroflexi bacterium]|nr:tetratricopeptide repeat protein [Chloroflexota bacterium]